MDKDRNHIHRRMPHSVSLFIAGVSDSAADSLLATKVVEGFERHPKIFGPASVERFWQAAVCFRDANKRHLHSSVLLRPGLEA